MCITCVLFGHKVFAIDLQNVTVKTVLNNGVPKTVAQNVKLNTLTTTSGLPTMDEFCRNYTYEFVEEVHITNFDFIVMQDAQGSDSGYELVCHYQNLANLPQVEQSEITKDYNNFYVQFLTLFFSVILFVLVVGIVIIIFK